MHFRFATPARVVSNLEFLQVLFSDLPAGVAGWCASFPGDPADAGPGAWRGFPVRPKDPAYSTLLPSAEAWRTNNTFTTFAGFKALEGAPLPAGRLQELFWAQYAIMLDDIGTGTGAKIGPERLALEPSWVVETSPDNWQVGYLLREPCRDGALISALIDALIEIGLEAPVDPGMRGLTRYGRLPEGINGKVTYRDDAGATPRHRLLHWRPDLRYSPAAIAAAYGISEERLLSSPADRVGSASRFRARSLEADPWAVVLAEAGLVKGEPRDKGPGGAWVDVTCPWVDQHTGSIDNGSAYCLGGGFECHHGHCRDRTWSDVRNWLLREAGAGIRNKAQRLRAEQAFGEEWLAPPAPVIREKTTDLQAEIVRLDGLTGPARGAAVDALIQQLAGTEGLSERAEAEILNDIKDKANVTGGVAVLKRDLKTARRRRETEAFQARHRARAIEDSRSQQKPVLPLLLPGDWPDTDEEGIPRHTSRNVEAVLQRTGGGAHYNEMTRCIETDGRFKGFSLDWALQHLRDACEINGLRLPIPVLRPMLQRIAADRGFHPFRLFLQRLQEAGAWDGRDRLRGPDGLFNTVRVVPEHVPLRDLILGKWLASVVAAARGLYGNGDGNHPRGVLVFVGAQHSGKTTWLRRLFTGLYVGSGRCFLDGACFDGTKDSIMMLSGYLVVELGEIDSTLNRAELGRLKAFLSASDDPYRAPFGTQTENHPRQTIFTGTVNRADFLRDTTGNTRFWTLHTDRLDLDAQKRMDMSQLWAQVQTETLQGLEACRGAAEYRALPWQLLTDEMRQVEAANEGHRVQSRAELLLLDTFDWDHPAWKAAQTPEERLKINPLRFTEIQTCCGVRHAQMRSEEWTVAIRLLTGQNRAKNTSIVCVDADGKKFIRRGRLFGMPPVRNLREDFLEPPAAPEEKVH